MYCEYNAILSQYEAGIKASPLKCGRWQCLDCRECRRKRLRAEAFRGKPNAFITLTVNPDVGESPTHRAQLLVDAWRKVRRRAKKHWGNKKIPFLAVFEETKKDEPHLHILARLKWIPQDWLSEQMQAEIGAPVVDIRRVNSGKKAAGYVSKYVGKNPEKFEGCKRYWRSLDWFLIPKKVYKDEIGEATKRWWVQGDFQQILRDYCKKFYRLETYQIGNKTEYWLVDDWPSLWGNKDELNKDAGVLKRVLPQELPPGLFTS